MSWLNASLTTSLARALVHFIWEGAAIAALLALMLAVLRGASAQTRYVAACAAMAAMAASFAATFRLCFGPDASFPVLRAVAYAIPDPTAAGRVAGASGRMPFASWAVGIWVTGVAILLLRRSAAWIAGRRLVRRAAILADALWIDRLDALRRRLGWRSPVGLLESALVEAPAVTGWLRPVVLVPAGWLMQLPPDQVEAVLLHELAHVQRHDYLANLLQSIVEDVLFYHPAVWWVGRVIRRERENCCDDLVIAMGGDRREYARTLASLEGMRAEAGSVAASGGSLSDRIRRLVRPAGIQRASAAPLIVAAALVCAFAAALPAWQSPPPAPAPQSDAESPYDKWLKQDVAYIITDEERAAFKRLQSNEEREHFIEQFWQRRGTPFKEEHYARIARANNQFDEPGLPGWKTDRGRIYIVYGPPDEKEVHPSGERGGPPFEEWMYHKIDGMGQNIIVRFEDNQRNGRFTQTSAPNTTRPPKAQAKPADGDLFYQANGATVRVGEFGATLITIPANHVRIRVDRRDAGGAAIPVLQDGADAPGKGYSKLLVLKPGQYTLHAEISDEISRQDERRAAMEFLDTELANARSTLAAARQTYTDRHPEILQLQAQIAHLEEERRAQALSEQAPSRSASPSSTNLDFQVR